MLPLFVQVNVYRSRSGWLAVTMLKRSGGQHPLLVKTISTTFVCDGDKTIEEATQIAARVLGGLHTPATT